jgi:hypothetical protein
MNHDERIAQLNQEISQAKSNLQTTTGEARIAILTRIRNISQELLNNIRAHTQLLNEELMQRIADHENQ